MDDELEIEVTETEKELSGSISCEGELFEARAIANLSPGDIVVCRHNGTFSQEQLSRLTSQFRRIFGSEIKVMLLEEGLDIEVIRKAL